MQSPKPWFNRKFPDHHEPGVFPAIIERLAGTSVRLQSKIWETPREHYTTKPEGKWSFKEHLGHLLDLESLWYGRVADIVQGEETMREADLSNAKTDQANHNDTAIDELWNQFKKERQDLVARLRKVPASDFEKSALHPRLLQPMKLINLAYFIAEHDDHHLAMMTWVVQQA